MATLSASIQSPTNGASVFTAIDVTVSASAQKADTEQSATVTSVTVTFGPGGRSFPPAISAAAYGAAQERSPLPRQTVHSKSPPKHRGCT